MRQRRLACLAAGTAAALSVVASPATPAHAVTLGEGAVVGTIAPCASQQTTITFDAPVFDFGGDIGPLHASGPSNCQGVSILANGGSDLAIDVTGPGFSCPDLGGGWTAIGAELRLIIGGPCTFSGGAGPRNMQFIVEAAYAAAAGRFAGSATGY